MSDKQIRDCLYKIYGAAEAYSDESSDPIKVMSRIKRYVSEALHSESAGVNSAVWVGAGEKPTRNGFYAVKYQGGGYGGCGFIDSAWNQSMADQQIIFWLHESPAAAQSGKEEITNHEHEKEVMMQAFDKVRQLFEARRWITEGRGSYPYDDDRYKEEVRYLYQEFMALYSDTWLKIKSKSFEYRNKIIEQYKKESGKEEAVAILEWAALYGLKRDIKGHWYRPGYPVDIPNNCTTSQLYDIYKSSK